MSALHRLMAGAYHPIKMLKAIGRPLGLTSPDALRVLLYHDIHPREKDRFAAQLRWLARSWNFVSTQRFASMLSRDEPVRGRNLLLTFDDGFASNRVVAEEVLNPMGIRALFFAVSDFVDLQNRVDARRFIARHILPGSDAEALPSHLYNMGWTDLEALLDQGHSIGGHTRLHARLSQVKTQEILEQEIIDSADVLAQRLGVSIEHFAFTFGELTSFSEAAMEVAQRRFRFIYSGLRGDNVRDGHPWAIRRDAMSAMDSFSLMGAILEGGADRLYAKSRIELDGWSRGTCPG